MNAHTTDNSCEIYNISTPRRWQLTFTVLEPEAHYLARSVSWILLLGLPNCYFSASLMLQFYMYILHLSSKFFFLVSLCGVRMSPLGTSATVGLLYQPRMIDDDYGAVGGMRIGRGNQSNRRKPTQCHFVHHKSHMTWPGIEPGPPRWEASD
jgi:hypothetical protein